MDIRLLKNVSQMFSQDFPGGFSNNNWRVNEILSRLQEVVDVDGKKDGYATVYSEITSKHLNGEKLIRRIKEILLNTKLETSLAIGNKVHTSNLIKVLNYSLLDNVTLKIFSDAYLKLLTDKNIQHFKDSLDQTYYGFNFQGGNGCPYSLPAFFLSLVYPQSEIIYLQQLYTRMSKFLGRGSIGHGLRGYLNAREFLRELNEELKIQGLNIVTSFDLVFFLKWLDKNQNIK